MAEQDAPRLFLVNDRQERLGIAVRGVLAKLLILHNDRTVCPVLNEFFGQTADGSADQYANDLASLGRLLRGCCRLKGYIS
ncbi:hypothetical protein QY97_00344 [Bacillus thermotolerans]|nr:hypothetical protein QY97_00344 [Bacillus thermotolerans]KKB33127.1 hypothetical protein QY96_00695 [Bacillus thermotolerans]